MRVGQMATISIAAFVMLTSGFCRAQEQEDSTGYQHIFADLPIPAVVNVNIADIRKEPTGHSEVTSQALFNEKVTVLQEDRRAAYIRQQDNYEGWIRKSFLTVCDSSMSPGKYVIVSNLASAYTDPEPTSTMRKTYLPYGARVDGILESGFLMITSERYGTLYIPSEDLLSIDSPERQIEPDSTGICIEGAKFMGTPYLWGGRSFFGIDCSGFTQLIMSRFGIDLPRDSKDQRKAGKEVGRDDIRAGDLLFFPHHVALALSSTLFIHSTNSNGGVAYNSLDPASPIYSGYHDKNLEMVRRVK